MVHCARLLSCNSNSLSNHVGILIAYSYSVAGYKYSLNAEPGIYSRFHFNQLSTSSSTSSLTEQLASYLKVVCGTVQVLPLGGYKQGKGLLLVSNVTSEREIAKCILWTLATSSNKINITQRLCTSKQVMQFCEIWKL